MAQSVTQSVSVLLGTTKGAFVLRSNPARSDWELSGPFCDGAPINHVIGDPATGMIWAAGGGGWYPAGVWRSADGGASWDQSTAGFADAGLQTLWSLGRSGPKLYAGSKPAALFESTDQGQSWTRVEGLSNHASAADWSPGAAGLVLHSIVADPDQPAKLWVGISAAGVFATEDGGKSWDRRNRRSNHPAAAGPSGDDHDHGTEVGLCVHNLVRGPDHNDRLYQQNHHGVFSSPDGGRTWQDMTAGLPSTFGFPIAVHPRDPQTVWVIPLNGDSAGRFPPDAAAAVWRSRSGGAEWEALRHGLPGKNCFFTVLRQAMAVDRATPAGLYFGTNSGSVFGSNDEGDTWTEIARHLPTVLSVETM